MSAASYEKDISDLAQAARLMMQQMKQSGSLSASAPNMTNGGADPAKVEELGKRFEYLEKRLKENRSKFGELFKGVGQIIKVNQTFKNKLEEAAETIGKSRKKFIVDVDKVAKGTFDLSKSVGAFDKSVLNNLRTQTAHNATLRDTVKVAALARKAEMEKIAIEEAALKTLKKKGTGGDAAAKAAKAKEVKALTTKINQMKSAMTNVRTVGRDAMKTLFSSVQQNSFIFDQLDANIQKSIKSGTIYNQSMKNQVNAIRQINQTTEVHGKALAANAEIGTKGAMQFKDNLLAVAGMIKAGFKVALDYTGDVLDNFNSQLKNNVFESHYTDAAKMGMNEGQMSELLGKYQAETRNMTGSQDGSKVLDDGRLKKLQQEVGHLYGLQGQEAAAKILQQKRDMNSLGVRATDEIAAQNLKDMKGMAMAAGMTTEALESFYSELGASGTLQAIASQHEGKSAKDKLAAIQKETGLLLKNGQVLGYSTEQIKKNMAATASNKYSSFTDKIMKGIGAQMELDEFRKAGGKYTAEEATAFKNNTLGIVSAEGQDMTNRIRGSYSERTNAATMEAGKGNKQALAKLDIFRTAIDPLGQGILSGDQLNDANIASQSSKAQFGDANAATALAGGDVSQNTYMLKEQLAKLPNSVDQFNTSLLVWEKGLQNLRELQKGIIQNPAFKAGESTAGGLIDTAGNVLMMKYAKDMILGTGGKGIASRIAGSSIVGAGVRGATQLATGAAGLAGSAGTALAGMGASGSAMLTAAGSTLAMTFATAVASAGVGALIGKGISETLLQRDGALGSDFGASIGDNIGAGMAHVMSIFSDDAAAALSINSGQESDVVMQTNKKTAEMVEKQKEFYRKQREEKDAAGKPLAEAANESLAVIAENTKKTADSSATQVAETKKANANYKQRADVERLVTASIGSAKASADRVASFTGT